MYTYIGQSSTQPDYLVGMTFSLILINFLTLKNSRTLSITAAYLEYAFYIYSNACKLWKTTA